MRKQTFLGWVLAALLCSFTASAVTQETDQAPGSSDERGPEISTLCEKFKATSAPCDKYIEKFYGSKSDLIISTVDAIDRQKDRARREAAHSRFWNRAMAGTLIVLGFLTTVSAAVARTFRDEKKHSLRLRNWLGLMPIIMSALVTLMASFNSSYSFEEARSQRTLEANELAKLQTSMNFELIRLVGENKESELSYKKIEEWQTRLANIMKVEAELAGGGEVSTDGDSDDGSN